jgi:hypothetical protein
LGKYFAYWQIEFFDALAQASLKLFLKFAVIKKPRMAKDRMLFVRRRGFVPNFSF